MARINPASFVRKPRLGRDRSPIQSIYNGGVVAGHKSRNNGGFGVIGRLQSGSDDLVFLISDPRREGLFTRTSPWKAILFCGSREKSRQLQT